MQRAFIYPARIIAVDNFSHQPELRLHFICHRAQSLHIIKIQHIRRVETDSVDIKLAYPKTDHIADIIPDGGIVLV